MLLYLGTRGRFATLAVVGVAISAAVYAATDHDWAGVATLVMLAYLAVLTGAAWGAVQAVLRTTSEVALCQQRIARRQGAQMRVVRTKVQRTYLLLTRTTSGSSVPAQHSVERRYAGVLDQPMSAPNSRLLSLLELLAKDATTRRADDAILQRSVGDLRELVEMQQAEISRLHELVATRNDLASPRSSM